MRRQHPFISLTGFGLTALFLLGLGASIWKNGGQAFSPGKLSAAGFPGVSLSGFSSHADFESQCERCHAPLDASQNVLCLTCHTSIQEQVTSGQGYHGEIARVERCASCHTEHQGREFDPGQAALKYFDHDQAGFILVRHGMDYRKELMKCASCHTPGGRYLDPTEGLCAACHGEHAAGFMSDHIQAYGSDCLRCHDGQDRMVDFDHSTTAFPLLGKHTVVTCAGCHAGKSLQQAADVPNSPFEGLSSECAECHAEPLAHQGIFDNKCQACHTEDGWLPANLQGALFEHAGSTGFSLGRHRTGFDGQALTCSSCHASRLSEVDRQACTDCHSAGDDARAAYMRAHVDQYGNTCLDCHDGVDRMTNFDHAQVFPLDGAHGEIECTSCHRDRVYHGTPTACVECHAEPSIHAGVFGVSCQDCHTTQAWAPARLVVHRFPLDHGNQGEVACTTCHVSTYITYTCYGCHEHQPAPIQAKHNEENIAQEKLTDCAACHPEGK